jgi:DNA mismatch endonuclease (patch repair protein)
MGVRYRLNVKSLPGSSDVVLSKYKAVVFVHGCFWHRHTCKNGRETPKTNADYWLPKLRRNVQRDNDNKRLLARQGWKTLIIWECWTKDPNRVKKKLVDFLGDRGLGC